MTVTSFLPNRIPFGGHADASVSTNSYINNFRQK